MPGLKAGDTVEVSVRRVTAQPAYPDGKRPFGLLAGKIHMAADFDEPIDVLEPQAK